MRSATEVILDLTACHTRLEGKIANLDSSRVVKEVISAVGDKGKPNGRGWSWYVLTRDGVNVSLFYQESMGNDVEVMNPKGVVREHSTTPDREGIAYIDVADLRYCF